jgi:uncharacterized protein (DUF362 family)
MQTLDRELKEHAPRALLIGHDPRLRQSDTQAEYALFANYYFDKTIRGKAFKSNQGLVSSAFNQITYITNQKINNDNGLQDWKTGRQAVTDGIFYCRDSAYFSVSATNIDPYMKRKKFLNITTTLPGFCLLVFLVITSCQKPKEAANDTRYPDLIVVKGGNVTDRYHMGIQAFGTLERVNIKRQKVLVKPTLKWDVPPGSGLSTNPDLLAAVIQDCYDAKSGGVSVTANTVDDWRACYKNSGIEETAKKALAKVIPSGIKEYYIKPKAGKLHFHKLTKKCDLIINVATPIPGETFEAGIASLAGLTLENNFAGNNSEEYFSELLQTCKPALTIIDIVDDSTLIISADPVLADAMACRVLGIDPVSVPYLAIAEKPGVGPGEIDKVDIQVIEVFSANK